MKRVIKPIAILLVVATALGLFVFLTPKFMSPSTDGVMVNSPEILRKLGKMVTDAHVHVACLDEEKYGCFISEEFKSSRQFGLIDKFSIYMKSLGTSLEEIKEKGDEIVVARLSERLAESKFVKQGIVLALDGAYDEKGELDRSGTQVRVSNRFVYESTKEYNNLLFGASINPFRKDAIGRLQWAKKSGAVLVKWIPCIMNFSPNDPRIKTFYEKLVEYELPLLSHTGSEHSFMLSDHKLCDPSRLELPLSMGVKVIAAHLGTLGEGTLAELRELFERYPNLYSDNSSLTQVNKYNHLAYTFDKVFAGRILYGSDFPLIEVDAFGVPLVSHHWYRSLITSEWFNAINALESVFDRDVALKLALGMAPAVLSETTEFFTSHK